MFSQHVTKKLSAYCHGEVASEESRQIAEHLIACNRCRAQYDEIKLGVKLAERLPQLSAPDSLWLDIQNSLAEKNDNGSMVSRPSLISFKVWRPGFVTVVAALLLVVGFAALWLYSRETRPFWEVARLTGAPMIGSARMDEKGRLPVGEWLETDGSSRAQIDVGSIGKVEIDPNTRVRLITTKATEHRLELEHGRLSARIWAPPRLFFVDTPTAVAADLGCAYTLEVDDKGAGILHVTSGWVALQLKDRESMVPAGAACLTRPGIGPGTPYFEDASENFQFTLAQFDYRQHDASELTMIVDAILREARARDTLTLWHLLGRVEGNDRVHVYERIASFTPPPDGVTREGVLQLNKPMLQLWKDKLETTWGDEANGGVRKAWIKIWTAALGKAKGLEGKR